MAQGYAKLANDFWSNPKIRKLMHHNPEAVALMVISISYSSDHLTDGHISEDAALYTLNANEDAIASLVDAGIWEPDGDGWTIHGYLDQQNSKADIDERRAAATERKRKSRANTTTTVTPQSQPQSHISHTSVTRDTTVTHNDVTPSSRLNKNQNQNQNQKEEEEEKEEIFTAASTFDDETQWDSPDIDADDGTEPWQDATMPAKPAENPAPTALADDDEHTTIDLWAPSPACQALADELAAEGQPRVDLSALARDYRIKLHARGCASYNIQPNRRSIDAYFRSWITSEARYMAERAEQTKRAAIDYHVTPPHEHAACCEHTKTLLANIEHLFDHTGDRGRSQWFIASDAAAKTLNAGGSPEDAIAAAQAIRTTVTEGASA